MLILYLLAPCFANEFENSAQAAREGMMACRSICLQTEVVPENGGDRRAQGGRNGTELIFSEKHLDRRCRGPGGNVGGVTGYPVAGIVCFNGR